MLAWQFFPTLWLGLLAGGHHALSGADHFAGVAPFAAGTGARAWRVGVAWGLGHASGAAAAAGLALGLRAWIPGVEAQLSSSSDRIVGMLMCVVGALGLRAALRAGVHEHEHRHGALAHAHAHVRPLALLGMRRSAEHAHGHSACVLGFFHGAGGLAHVFAVVPALGLPGVALPALYLCGYLIGSLVLITAFATGIGRISRPEEPRLRRRALFLASGFSLAVGLVWIVKPG